MLFLPLKDWYPAVTIVTTLLIVVFPLKWVARSCSRCSEATLNRIEFTTSRGVRVIRAAALFGSYIIAVCYEGFTLFYHLNWSTVDPLLELLETAAGGLFLQIYIFPPLMAVTIRLNNSVGVPAHLELMKRRALRDCRPPLLLLRSFTGYALNTFHMRDTNQKGQPMPGGRSASVDYAMALDRIASSLGPLVWLGGDIPTGKWMCKIITNSIILDCPDAHWRALFQSAARASRAIFLIPGLTRGVIDEIEFVLTENLISKTIVLMPACSIEFRKEAQQHF
jgi:hypothetical protein